MYNAKNQYSKPGAGYSVVARYGASEGAVYSDEGAVYGSTALRKNTRYLGCTCSGNSPCRGTCRTLFVQ